MIPEINYFAVIAATVSSMVVGSIWYAQKVLGNTWIRLAKVTPGEKYGPVWPIVITVIVSFITAWVLAGASYDFVRVLPGFVLGLGAAHWACAVGWVHGSALYYPRRV